MKKKLVLLTSQFPVGSGEVFLENEIPFLKEVFDDLVVFPTKIKEGSFQNEIGTKKNTVVESERQSFPWRIVISFLFSSSFAKELSRLQFSFFKWKVFFNYLIKASNIFLQCESIVRTTNFPTVFYSYWADESAVALSLLKKKYGDKVVCVTRVHGWDLYFDRHPKKYLPLRTLILEYVDGICPISDIGMTYINTEWSSKSNQNLKVFRLGVKEGEFFPKERKRKLIVSCSSLIPLKRIELIIEALSRFSDSKIEWVHFGDGPEMSRLESLANRKLRHISWVLHGDKSNDTILSYYKENRPGVFINVSISEGIPVSIMEAMSFGIPCIATNVGGTSEIVNNKNGQLIDANISTNDLYLTLKKFIEMDSLNYESLSIGAKYQWEERYSSQTNYTEFSSFLVGLK